MKVATLEKFHLRGGNQDPGDPGVGKVRGDDFSFKQGGGELTLDDTMHYEEMFINVGNNRIWESKNVELLGITKDKDKHRNKIYSNANRKLNVLSRMRSFLSAEKRRISPLLNHNSNDFNVIL